MPLPLTVSCFSKIQIWIPFLPPNQQHQSTEGNTTKLSCNKKYGGLRFKLVAATCKLSQNTAALQLGCEKFGLAACSGGWGVYSRKTCGRLDLSIAGGGGGGNSESSEARVGVGGRGVGDGGVRADGAVDPAHPLRARVGRRVDAVDEVGADGAVEHRRAAVDGGRAQLAHRHHVHVDRVVADADAATLPRPVVGASAHGAVHRREATLNCHAAQVLRDNNHECVNQSINQST